MSQPDLEASAFVPPPSNAQDRDKYQSPPPPPSSFTPPPSSKTAPPAAALTQARTPTPTHSHLSSPPPTIRTPPPRQRASSDPDRSAHLSGRLLDAPNSSIDDLRTMLADATAECHAANTSAAHHRLQYELLSMEHTEALKRFEVELDMAKKEVEVLQHTTSQASLKPDLPSNTSNGTSSTTPATNLTILDLQNHLRLLEAENQSLHMRLADAKAIILDREGVMAAENDRLKRRIRENREHMNRMRKTSLLFGEHSSPHHLNDLNAPYTPSRRIYPHQYSTPNKRSGQDEPFAALLLADQVLSQEAASNPSTPISSQQQRQQSSPSSTHQHSRQHHQRGVQSMSSLPSTPYRSTAIASSTPNVSSSTYHSRSTYVPSSSAPVYSTPTPHRQQHQTQQRRRHRRDSRDSTISASDANDGDQEADRVLDSEPESNKTNHYASHDSRTQEVYSSQASQEAANMLRKSSSSFARYQPQTSPNKEKSFSASAAPPKTVQSKLHGYQVTKPASASSPTYSDQPSASTKRHHEADEAQMSPDARKKLKAASAVGVEGVGLGIGGWTAH